MNFDLYLVLEAKGVVIHSLVLFRILADLKIKSMYRVWNEPAQEILLLYAQVQINKTFQRKIVNIFLPINFNICFGCLKEPSH